MGKWCEDFRVHRSIESLVSSWVRRVVGDDCVEILRVVFRQHMQSLKFSLPFNTTLKIKKKKLFQLLHFVSYFLQVNVSNAAHVPRTLDSM